MAEITPDQVARLLWAVETANEAKVVADAARDALDHVLLSTACEARVGLRELSALTGLHSNTIRAGIQRAAGPTTIDFEQPELEIGVGLSEDVSTVRGLDAASRGLAAVRASYPQPATQATLPAPTAGPQARPSGPYLPGRGYGAGRGE
jgi:hypothetical protein